MRRNYHFSLLKVCALCFAVQFSLQVPCACKAILIVFDNAGTLCMRTLRKKPTPGVFDYAGSHSAKRNLRDSARSRAFDNAGSRSACATCAMDVVPARSLIVRDPRRSQLRRSTRSTICPSRAALLDAVTAMFGRSLRLPLALCSATDAVATMCNRSHLSASDGCAARSTTRGDVGAFTASVETM